MKQRTRRYFTPSEMAGVWDPIHARREKTEVRGRELRVRDALEIKHVKRLIGRRDERVRLVAEGPDPGRDPGEHRSREHGL